MESIVYNIGSALVISLIVWFLFNRQKKIDEGLQEMADKHGLSVAQASWPHQPQLKGSVNGVDIHVYSEVWDNRSFSGDSRRETHLVHRAQMSPSATPNALVMFAKSPSQSMEKGLGKIMANFLKMPEIPSIENGMQDIDAMFCIQGVGKQEALEFLNRPGVESALLELIRANSSMRLEKNAIQLRTVTKMSNLKRVREGLERIVKCSEVLEREGRHAIEVLERDSQQPNDAEQSPAATGEDKIIYW